MIPRTSRPVRSSAPQQGFTLIEVLVSIVILTIMLGLVGLLLSSMRMSRTSRASLDVNQSVNSYLDSVYASWQNALAYRNGTLPPPPTIQGRTWKLVLHTINPSTGAASNARTYTQGSSIGAYNFDEPIKRVTLTYSASLNGSGGSYVGSLEVGRP